jgi:hypothetical protein
VPYVKALDQFCIGTYIQIAGRALRLYEHQKEFLENLNQNPEPCEFPFGLGVRPISIDMGRSISDKDYPKKGFLP